MNCILCHDTNASKFVDPARTLLLMEPTLASNDVSVVVGPAPWLGTDNHVLSSRYNGSGHLVFCDFHFERVKSLLGQKLERSKRFWLAAPTTDSMTAGIVASLPDA